MNKPSAGLILKLHRNQSIILHVTVLIYANQEVILIHLGVGIAELCTLVVLWNMDGRRTLGHTLFFFHSIQILSKFYPIKFG